ncbi:MAG TPA: zinc ribbon domain-containing protein [Gammaproteobacteria bacterium]|nr:zinc ribbon domain-containing protein [Gammaproteobacteria bacterium]
MPIYEYRCKACDHELEAMQKISDAPLVECPECGKPELTKLVSAAGFRLSGSGWYETDFKSGNKKNLKESGSSESSSSASSGGCCSGGSCGCG